MNRTWSPGIGVSRSRALPLLSQPEYYVATYRLNNEQSQVPLAVDTMLQSWVWTVSDLVVGYGVYKTDIIRGLTNRDGLSETWVRLWRGQIVNTHKIKQRDVKTPGHSPTSYCIAVPFSGTNQFTWWLTTFIEIYRYCIEI